ncbi:DEAD/DEAH box helicase [Erythrobacter sp. SCSIO 43205]|uniref:DEAD/DEAH box helicase n=1 Tax=Erythrobacter sp. SCSIO 43205 TaxID=2779361 RepID=UPI001CA808AB|nr:DEAD/DEAH box helicase [Erythrobacter sp. SCSIO 43205]UAB76983.1 DEAD/DEAH box helicase [Erythrobacter sp. SCSIO 43205]
MTLVLRPYQERCLADLWHWFERHTGNPLAVLPTGAGKSLVIAEWCKGVCQVDPSAGILILAHVRELIQQNAAEMIGLWPDAPVGIYAAGLNRREMGKAITFASIQSIHRKAYDLPRRIDMVLVDEAHLIPRKSNTMYGRFLADLKTINPYVKIIGLTATPFRLDSGLLHEGQEAMFDGIAHDTNVRELFDEGFLSPPRTYRQQAQIDTSGVGVRAGEFIASQLENAAMDPATTNAIADRIVEAGQDRAGWLAFGCSVAHCEALTEALRERGYSGATITGEMDKGERDSIIGQFKARQLRFLTSMQVLTTGFNARHVDLIALARPTQSTGLYIQMVGRGTRLSPETGKTDCLVLDFGGNIARHGPFDDPFLPASKAGKGEGSAPVKECPECGCATGTASSVCPACGFEYPPPEKVVTVTPDAKPILSVEPEWLEVSQVRYRAHAKPGKPTSLRVEYVCGLTVHREWVCLEHEGYARQKAEGWWLRRAGAPVPTTVAEAIERAGEVAEPSAIRVKREGKYDRVTAYQFEPASERKVA